MINIIEIQDREGGIYHPITDAKAVKLPNGDNLQQKAESLDTQIAGKVDKVAGKGLSANDYTTAEKNKLSGAAPLDSPAFTGTPQAPTPDMSDNSAQIATTAFVKAQKYAAGSHTHTAAEVGAVDQKSMLSNSDIEEILNS